MRRAVEATGWAIRTSTGPDGALTGAAGAAGARDSGFVFAGSPDLSSGDPDATGSTTSPGDFSCGEAIFLNVVHFRSAGLSIWVTTQ